VSLRAGAPEPQPAGSVPGRPGVSPGSLPRRSAPRALGRRREASAAAQAPTDPAHEGVHLRLDAATVERARQTVLEEEQRHQPARGTRDVVHAVNDESAVLLRLQGVHAAKPPPALHNEGATRTVEPA